MDKQDKSFYSDLSYIKTVMAKSEFAYEHFKRFFLGISLFSFITGILVSILSLFLFNHIRDSSSGLNDIMRNVQLDRIILSVAKVILLMPILVFIIISRKKVKNCGQGISLWLFDIISFVIIFCGFIFPLVTISSTSSNTANIYIILNASLCLLLCGVFTGDKILKIISYFYFAVPAIFMVVNVSTLAYIQIYGVNNSTSYLEDLISIYSLTEALIFIFYPCIGYLIISLRMNSKIHASKTNDEV